jgi:hypothetical protein
MTSRSFWHLAIPAKSQTTELKRSSITVLQAKQELQQSSVEKGFGRVFLLQMDSRIT